MAEMAEAIGKSKDAQHYRDLFEKIKAAFDKAYVSNDVLIKGDTQTCYVLALSMNLLSEAKREKAQNRLVELLRKSDWRMGTGFLGTKPLLPVLSELGRTDIAYRLLRSTEFPSWGYSIEQGATTIWERWNSYTKEKGFETPGMNSFNHYAFGAVCEWMFSYMAGIDTDGPGYKRILIRPRPDSSMDFVKAHYNSVNGRIATDWKIKDSDFLLSVTIPANTTATVYVPAKSPETVTESGKSLQEAESIHFLNMRNDYVVCEIGSGVYEFLSSGVTFPGKK
jgi:alpha-L-rhamnosidase